MFDDVIFLRVFTILEKVRSDCEFCSWYVKLTPYLSVEIFQERNKLFLTRAVVLELVHAVKFRSSIPDTNLQSVLQVHNLALVKVK